MTSTTADDLAAIRTQLRALANLAISMHATRFFKSGVGEYGEGDQFLGIRVPVLRRVAREHRAVSIPVMFGLLRSPLHEERLLALLLLVAAFKRSDESGRKRIYGGYLRAIRRYVNNWDLVDTSAPDIAGQFLEHRARAPLYELARSRNLWERRVAILATFWFIRRNDFADTLRIAELLLLDEHDLIHKAVGWMLREVGNRDAAAAARFLNRHHRQMPRTMLRYAIEKLSATQRRAYLNGKRQRAGVPAAGRA
ncbi:MAG: DNA alkylation repair protein [Gammaproteobacteria bacterium]